MSIYKSFVKHILKPLDLWQSGDYAEITYWKEFEKTQYLQRDELNALVWQRLRNSLERAYRNIPYYKASFDRAGIVPSDIKTGEDMLHVPMLSKQELQTNLDELVNPNYPAKLLIRDKTGGSTGTPVQYFYDRKRHLSRHGGAMRHDRWAGHEDGQRFACLWGAARDLPMPGWKQKLRSMIYPKTLILNTINMTSEIMLDFNRQLKKYHPPVILAYANALALFARFLKNSGETAYHPKGIITSAEVLRPEDRIVIEEVMCAPVFNRLGCREFSVIASECEKHNGMHIMAEGLYIEIVKDGRHCADGERGEIIVTDMLNEAGPLIRYRLGDTASWMDGTCSCGRSLPRIDQLEGRVTDFIVGMDNQLCSGAALTVLIISTMPSLGQIQIIQEEWGKILYRVGCGKDGTLSKSDFDLLREKTELYLGKGIGIDYEFVDNIPHEASGKYIFSKSKIAEEMMK